MTPNRRALYAYTHRAKDIDDNDVTTILYGHILAVTRTGTWLFEERVNGTMHVVMPSEVERVMPYTVAVKFYNKDGGLSSTVYHYFAKDGQYAVGDLLLFEAKFATSLGYATVVAVNTANEKATKWLSGWVISNHLIDNSNEAVVSDADDGDTYA